MKHFAFAILIMGWALALPAETIEALLARLVVEDKIEAYGTFAQVGSAVPVNDEAGARDLSEWKVDNVMVRTARGQRKGSIVLTVYDRGQEDEAAYFSEGDENYEAPIDKNEQVARGRAAIRSMIAGAIPIPSTPSEALPMDVTDSDLHNKVIKKYLWPTNQDVDEGEILAARVVLILTDDTRAPVRISVDRDTLNFVIESVE